MMKNSDKSNDKSGFQMEAELENKEKRPGNRLGNILLIILFLPEQDMTTLSSKMFLDFLHCLYENTIRNLPKYKNKPRKGVS